MTADQYANTENVNTDTLTNQISNIRQNTGLFFNLLSSTHFRIINQNDVVDNNAFGANLTTYYNWYFNKLTQVENYSKIDLVVPNNDPEIKAVTTPPASDMNTEMNVGMANNMTDDMNGQMNGEMASSTNNEMPTPPATN